MSCRPSPLACSVSDSAAGLAYEAAHALVRLAAPGAARGGTSFFEVPPRKRTFQEIAEAVVQERNGDGRLCVRGEPGCDEKGIKDPTPTKQGTEIPNMGDTDTLLGNFGDFLGVSVDRKQKAKMRAGDFAEAIRDAVKGAALRGRGEGDPPVDPQTGPPVRVSDLWKWMSNVQMRRAKKAALIADSAVQEAWRQQRLARYYTHEALVAEAATIRALPRPTSDEVLMSSKPGRYPIPPELAKFSERQTVPPGWELPAAPLVDQHSHKGALRLLSSAAPGPAPAPAAARGPARGPRRRRGPSRPPAFL